MLDEGKVVEIHPADGQRLEMSATAQEALHQSPGKLIRESTLSFSRELPQ